MNHDWLRALRRRKADLYDVGEQGPDFVPPVMALDSLPAQMTLAQFAVYLRAKAENASWDDWFCSALLTAAVDAEMFAENPDVAARALREIGEHL